jgi:hypothetical protein
MSGYQQFPPPSTNITSSIVPTGYYMEPPAFYYPPSLLSPKASLILIGVIILIILIFVFVGWMRKPAYYAESPVDTQTLRSALMAKGWKLWIRTDCVYCQNQLDTLGGHYNGTIVCPGTTGCDGISAFPTWTNGTSTIAGVQSYKSLKMMAGI